MKFKFLFLTVVSIACSSGKTQYDLITEDYCAQQEELSPKSLNDLINLSEIDSTKTGVLVLEEGDISMIFRAWLSEAAQETIDIQYFIFSGDNVGLIAIDLLLKAAERGVKIRLLVDDIMVEADADDLLALDSHPNLEIKIYNPTTNIGKNLPAKLQSLVSDFRGVNQRMHNKTFSVDGKVIITGGRNIADEYFDYDHAYNFRDRDVMLIGKSVTKVSESFSLFWESDLSVPVEDLVRVSEAEMNVDVKFEYLHQYACNPDNFWPVVRTNIENVPNLFEQLATAGEVVWVDDISFVSDLPGKNDGTNGLEGGGLSTDTLINLIENAKTSVHIQTPYLVTTELSQQLFQRAVQRGVEIKILTNSLLSTDNLEAFSGYKREREKLLEIGLQIYEFRPDAAIRYQVMTGALQREIDFTPIFGLHAKSMVVDKEVAVIGTFNLDPRSANLNTECIAVIRDPTIAGNLFTTMAEELKPENAWQTTIDSNPDSYASRGKRFQLWLRRVVPKSIL
ncbi:MAG: phospholipase D family protein [Cyclobacteriaceae bacterium]